MINCWSRPLVFALLLLSVIAFSSFTSCSEPPIIEFKDEKQVETATIEQIHLDDSTSSYEEKSVEVVTSSKPSLSENQGISLLNAENDKLVNPISSTESINLNLKNYIMEHFNIPELESVDENEPELAEILSLEKYRNDPSALFVAIAEDIFSGHRLYKNISRALIKYLLRTFKELKNVRGVAYNIPWTQSYFWDQLIKYSENTENFDFVFEHYRNDRIILLDCFKNVKNKKSMMEFFKANPDKANEYHLTIINEESLLRNLEYLSSNLVERFVDYIIYDAPDMFYENIFASRSGLGEITKFITLDLFLFQDIPDSEYSRIHGQIRKLFEIYPSQNLINNLEFYNLFIDLRFGFLDQLNTIDFDKESLVLLAKAALLGNKPDIFLMINDHYNEKIGTKYKIILSIMEILSRKDVKLSAVHKLNPIFELIVRDKRYFTASKCIRFLLKFYTLNYLKVNSLYISSFECSDLEFVALDNSLSLPRIRFYNQRDFIPEIARSAFSHIKVLNENTLISLMRSCKDLFHARIIPVSFELVEFVANNPSLVQYFRKNSFEFCYYRFDDFIKYLSLPNFLRTMRLFYFYKLKGLILKQDSRKFKFQKGIKSTEKIKEQTITKYLTESEFSNEVLNGFNYHELCLVFAQWVKSDQKQRIKEIKNSDIIDILEIEFPNEMNQIMNSKAI